MTIEPVRVRMSRQSGFNLQVASAAINGLPAVSVARPGKWGNPYPVVSSMRFHPKEAGFTPEQAVAAFKGMMHGKLLIGAVDLEPLRGKNLACWCKLGEPCHADVLLELANKEPTHDD